MWTESGVEYMLVYIYDESGAPIGLQYRTDAYGVEEFDSFFFEKNLQGDIVAIYNENGVKIGQYQYDAWGNHSAKHFTTKLLDHRILYNYNPFRYRGYYYDLETGFYYLQSRYYNPEWCRFISARTDVPISRDPLGYNMYMYCNIFISDIGTSGFLEVDVETRNVHLEFINTRKLIQYDVPIYSQGSLNLCWAYCQVMVECYQSGITYTQEEANMRAKEIAVSLHGTENWNQGGHPQNCTTHNIKINNIEALYNIVVTHGPVYAYYFNAEGRGHVVIVTGVDVDNGTIYTNNPWGIKGTQTFEEFCEGFAINPGQTTNNMTFQKRVCIIG